MTQLLEKAFAEAASLPEQDQDSLATWLLAELAAQRRWDKALEPDSPKPETDSRWAQVVARIEHGESLGDYAETFNRDRAEFRRELRFKHDES